MPRLHMSIALATLLSAVVALPAAGITVMNTNDSGPGSLRQAIADANLAVIDFDTSLYDQTITLTSGQLQITKAMTIDGNGRITVSGNKASRVFQIQSTGVTLKGLTIRDGSGTGGGGVYNVLGAIAQLVEVSVTGNVSTTGGGGILNQGTLTLNRSTVSENAAVTSYGGGIDNVFGATLTLMNSTVSGNVADGRGGGIDNYGTGSHVTATFSTIAFNRAGVIGGGIHASDGDASAVSLQGTILAKNSGLGGSPDCSGTLASADYNLLGSSTGCTLSGTTTHNLVGQDPKLGSLQLNGNAPAPRMHPLRPGSPAIDVVPSATCLAAPNASLDARSVSRPQDGNATGSTNCDVGAYEAVKPIVVNSLIDPTDAGKCTLRDAIQASDANADVNGCVFGGGPIPRIVFGVTGRIRLSGTELTPLGPVLIDGPGATQLTISAERASRVFYVGSIFELAGVTIANGRNSFASGVYDEYAPYVAIDAVAFEDNVASGGGNSVDAHDSGSVEIDSSSFSNTAARGGAGAVSVHAADATFRNCTFGESGATTAISVFATPTYTTHARLLGCTFAGSEDYGVDVEDANGAPAGSAVVEYRSCIVSGHRAGAQLQSTSPANLVSLGYNVISDGSGPTAGTDVKNADAKLAGHLYGGGLTKTVAPLAGSPAIDRVPLSSCFPTVDQRGAPRPLDGDRDTVFKCDAGAFEAAPPIVVNSLLDPSDAGKCTLRDAIASANANASINGCSAGLADAQDLITFGVTGTINLGSELVLGDSLAIRGPGAPKLTISGQGTTRVFNFSSNSTRDFTLTGLTVANGSADFGAGVKATATRTLSISEAMFLSNFASSVGGALYLQDATYQLTRSTFSNPSIGDHVLINAVNASGVVEGCTINEPGAAKALANAAGAPGAGYLLVKGSTLSGLASVGINSFVINATNPPLLTEYAGTIVSVYGTAFQLTGGIGVSLGYNLASDATGNLTATGDKPSTNPLLGPLGYHGGETPVFDLKAASPAKDAIPIEDCGQQFDQRGVARPFGATCDIGAVERVVGGDVNGDGSVNVSDIFYLINFLFAGGPVPIGEPEVNGDDAVNVGDVFYLINFLFAGGTGPV